MDERCLTPESGSLSGGIWPTAMVAWWAVAVFCLAGVLSYTDRLILGLLVDSIRSDLLITDTQISLLQGVAFAIIFAVAGFPLGRLTDIWSRRGLVVLGVATWTAGTVVCGLAREFDGLFLGRSLVGIGEAALAPAVLSLISDLFPPHRRGVAIGAYMTSLCLGAGVAMSVGGELLHAAEVGAFHLVPVLQDIAPWRAVLLFMSLPGVLICGLVFTVPEPRRHGCHGTLARRQRFLDALRQLAAHRTTITPLLGAMAFMSAGDFALLNWMPTLLGRVYHLPPNQAGTVLGAVSVVSGISGSLLAGLAGDRLVRTDGGHKRGFIAAWGAFIATATVLISMASTSTGAIACFGLWMFFSWGGQTLGAAALQDGMPNELRGLATAAMAFCNMAVGLSLGTTVTALLTDHLFNNPLAVGKSLAILVAPCAACAALLYTRAAKALERAH